jgi:hypothetical protein
MVISVSITRGVIATVASTSLECCPLLTLLPFEPNCWNNPTSARATWQYTFFSFFLSLDLEDEVVADVLASTGVVGSGSRHRHQPRCRPRGWQRRPQPWWRGSCASRRWTRGSGATLAMPPGARRHGADDQGQVGLRRLLNCGHAVAKLSPTDTRLTMHDSSLAYDLCCSSLSTDCHLRPPRVVVCGDNGGGGHCGVGRKVMVEIGSVLEVPGENRWWWCNWMSYPSWRCCGCLSD